MHAYTIFMRMSLLMRMCVCAHMMRMQLPTPAPLYARKGGRPSARSPGSGGETERRPASQRCGAVQRNLKKFRRGT